MTATADLTAGQPLIVQLLLERGILAPSKLEALREVQSKDHGPVEAVIVKRGLATDAQIAEAYSQYFVVPMYARPAGETASDPALGSLLPEKLCRDRLLAPVAIRGDMLDVAFVSADDLLMVDELQLLTGLTVCPLIAPFSVVEETLESLYSGPQRRTEFVSGGADYGENEQSEEIDRLHDEEVLELDKAPAHGQDGHVIRTVNQILEQALRIGASDIHLEPFEDSCAIRLRVDGALHELAPPPRSMFVPILSRFKILAKMDIAEKRVPQDGAIGVKSGNKRVNLRVSTVPTVYGEKMVMRILDKGAIPIELTGLGFDERQSKDLIESIKMPHGLMLVTGPTGSGKSTTLYACLNLLNEPDTNICTVEDPVEYKFKGMNQVQVKTMVGLTFASALRAFLRQDPDVIMVGEVRDQETAQICLLRGLDGPLRAFNHPHQRFTLGRQPPGRHGDRAVPAGLDASRAGGPAAHSPPLQGMQRTLLVRRGNGSTPRPRGRRNPLSPQGLRLLPRDGLQGPRRSL